MSTLHCILSVSLSAARQVVSQVAQLKSAANQWHQQVAVQMAILLSEGFGAKSVQIPQAPVHTTLLLQHFNQHKSSSNRKFTDVLMPVSNTLFGRPLQIVYDEGLVNMYRL